MSRRSDNASDLSLIRWAEQLRQDKVERRKLINRATAVGLGLSLLMGTTILPPAPRLVWNASASAPIGLYSVDPRAHVHVGDIVVAELPRAMRQLAAARHYLPEGVPLVKQIAAGPGDSICASGTRVLINGLWRVSRRETDARGRPMPHWNGCRILHDGRYLLLMPSVPASFDGRYFGTTDSSEIIGKAHLLWRR